jgi:hypothetical protein
LRPGRCGTLDDRKPTFDQDDGDASHLPLPLKLQLGITWQGYRGAIGQLQNDSLMTFIALIHVGSPALAGEFCGSKEGYLNQIASAFIIPDFFPPETEALRGLVSKADYERCSRIAFAYLGNACQAHDECYDARFPKEQCDKQLQGSWVKACRATYYKLTVDSQVCRLACESFVKLMSEAQRYDSGGVCPSCEAYN